MGLRVGSVGLFRYQHVGIGNYSHWGHTQRKSPNASGFALQWNIGVDLRCSEKDFGGMVF